MKCALCPRPGMVLVIPLVKDERSLALCPRHVLEWHDAIARVLRERGLVGLAARRPRVSLQGSDVKLTLGRATLLTIGGN